MKSFKKLLQRRTAILKKSISNVSRNANKVNVQKEQIILNRISNTIGKSPIETKQIVSKDLLSLLSTVPFTRF